MTVLQRAVPQILVHAYLTEGYDRVSGYVVRAAEVSSVTTIADLRRLHLLDRPGSRFPADEPLHILHVDKSPAWQLLPARAATIVEREVLDPSGTVEVDERLVEVFHLDHTRLTSGARLWRFAEGADPVLVGTYHGPALGWQDHTRDDALKAVIPTATVGAVVVIDDKAFVADIVSGDDGVPTAITAVAPSEPPPGLGFTQNVNGFWVRPVAHAQARALFEVRVTATWRGHPVQLAQQFRLPDGRVAARVCSMARDWTKAEATGFLEIDLGVWESTVPAEELKDSAPQEITATPWMTDWQRERMRHLEEATRANTVQGASVAGASATASAPPPGTVTSPPGTGLKDAVHQALYQRIAQGVIPHLPPGASEIQLLCESVGNVMELSAQAILEDGSPARVPTVSEDVARALGELRNLGRTGPEGPWFGALVAIRSKGEFTINFNRSRRPIMKREITLEMLRLERERFPRDVWPEWFLELEKAAGLAGPAAGPAGPDPSAI